MQDKPKIEAVPASDDNYIWIIHSGGTDSKTEIAIVDPGDATPVLQYIAQQQLRPTAILITHGCHDHVDGIERILKQFDLPVYGPAKEPIPHLSQPLNEGDEVTLGNNIRFKVLDVPGHTAGHIAYIGHNKLFCGDTLFSAGCGRLYTKNPQLMHNSLNKFMKLPNRTDIYCAHEYTCSNLRFALEVEPENRQIQNRLKESIVLRQQNRMTLPSTLAVEKMSNPFLRCSEPAVIAAAEQFSQCRLYDSAEVFAALRRWKDAWRMPA